MEREEGEKNYNLSFMKSEKNDEMAAESLGNGKEKVKGL